MTFFRILVAGLLLLTISGGSWAQSSGGKLAAELNELRQQQRQMERDIAQYQTSIKLLRASQNAPGDENATLQLLEAQLQQSKANLANSKIREQQYQAKLMPAVVKPPVATTAADYDPEAEEVARLKKLLASYRASEAQAAAAESAVTDADLAKAIANQNDTAYLADKVLLSGSEGLAAIREMDRVLVADSIGGQRRELDIIFHIEVRDDGKLVSSGSHSLKSLGKSQYITKVTLRGGTATLSVRKDSWVADINADEASDYLVTLTLARNQPPELHLISVQDLKSTELAEVPAWVPYIGSLTPSQS